MPGYDDIGPARLTLYHTGTGSDCDIPELSGRCLSGEQNARDS